MAESHGKGWSSETFIAPSPEMWKSLAKFSVISFYSLGYKTY
jgi:hypothetical protein